MLLGIMLRWQKQNVCLPQCRKSSLCTGHTTLLVAIQQSENDDIVLQINNHRTDYFIWKTV